MVAILDFTHNTMTKVRTSHTPMTAILDSIRNAIFKVLSAYITMSGITKTCMLDIMNLCLFYLK